MNKRTWQRNNGQGLVEYALILVLVAVVAIAILTLLGPQVGNVFSRVVSGLGVEAAGGPGGGSPPPTATVTNLSVTMHDGHSVILSISVSENTSVTLSDSVSGNTQTVSCNGSCSPSFNVGHCNSGTVTVTAPANADSEFYPASLAGTCP